MWDRVAGMSFTLPRQIVDVTDAVRAQPAPAVPTLHEPFTSRLADPDTDAAMIADWMSRPHLADTWDRDFGAQRWRDHLAAQRDGTYSRPMIVSDNGEPILYAEVYRPAQDVIAHLYDAEPGDIGIHLAMADPGRGHRGTLHALVGPFILGLLAREPDCRRILVDPEASNVAACSAAERFGGVSLGDHDLLGHRIRLYCIAIERGDTDTGETAYAGAQVTHRGDSA